jgi:hypothetical protein
MSRLWIDALAVAVEGDGGETHGTGRRFGNRPNSGRIFDFRETVLLCDYNAGYRSEML